MRFAAARRARNITSVSPQGLRRLAWGTPAPYRRQPDASLRSRPPRSAEGTDRHTPLDREIGHRLRERAAGLEVAGFDQPTKEAIAARQLWLVERGDMAASADGPAFTPRGWARLRGRDLTLSLREQLGVASPSAGATAAHIGGGAGSGALRHLIPR
jgi:hypothetical protein